MIGRADIIGIDLSGANWSASHVAKGPFGPEPISQFKLEGGLPDMAGQLKDYVNGLRSGSAEIALAMPHKNCLTRIVRLPAADMAAAARMIGFELERHLPSDAGQWHWSVDLMKTDRIISTVLLSAVKTKDIEGVSTLLREARLSPALVTSGQAALIVAARRSGFIAADELSAIASVYENEFTLVVVKTGMLLYSAHGAVGALSQEVAFAVSFLKESPESFIIVDEGASEDVIESASTDAREFCDIVRVFGPVPALSRSFGAAMMASENGFSSANLVCRDDVLPARGKALAVAGGAMLVLLAVGAGISAYDILSLKNMESEIDLLSGERAKAQAIMKQAGDIRSDLKTLDDIKGASSSEFLGMLSRLTEITPEDTYLTGLEYGKDGIVVAGVSSKASGLFMKLSRSGFAENINYDGPVTRAQDGKERFRIKFRHNGGQGNGDAQTGS